MTFQPQISKFCNLSYHGDQILPNFFVWKCFLLMNEAFFFPTELILKWIQPPSFAIPHCPVVEMLHCSSHFSTPGKSTSYPPSQCELTLYPSGLLWTIFASSVSFVVLFLQCTLSFDSIAKVIILCLSFIGSLSTFLLSGPP